MRATLLLAAGALASAASAQVTQFSGMPPNATALLDFDNPPVASGPINSTDAVFQAAAINSVTLVGTWTAGADSLTASSNVMGQGLISANNVLTVGGVGEPLDDPTTGAGFEIALAAPATEFGVLFIDQINMDYTVEFILGNNVVASDTFNYSGSFPLPGHYWTTGGAFDTVRITFPSTGGVGIDEIAHNGGSGTIGSNYCAANPHSGGVFATMSGLGSAAVASNDFTLQCSNMPTGQFGYFLNSQTQAFVMNPGGSQGNLCLGGSIGRWNRNPSEILNSGSTGVIELLIDLNDVPRPTGPGSINPGETWSFQAWFRDQNPTSTSNFSDGLEVMFL